jgi:hypothetical protein
MDETAFVVARLDVAALAERGRRRALDFRVSSKRNPRGR